METEEAFRRKKSRIGAFETVGILPEKGCQLIESKLILAVLVKSVADRIILLLSAQRLRLRKRGRTKEAEKENVEAFSHHRSEPEILLK
jgi:hypothetical protein